MLNIKKVNYKEKIFENTEDIFSDSDVVILKNFPKDMERLYNFCDNLGVLMERSSGYKEHPNELKIMKYIGFVKFEKDLDEAKRMTTQTSKKLGLHTARSVKKNRPRIFVMYMANSGWKVPNEDNGETLLVHIEDIVKLYSDLYPHNFLTDLELLLKTNISFVPHHIKIDESIANEPLITNIDGYRFRLISEIEKFLTKELMLHGCTEEIREALIRFQTICNDERIVTKIKLETEDLILINNEKVGHGRTAFHEFIKGQVNPRELWTLHIK